MKENSKNDWKIALDRISKDNNASEECFIPIYPKIGHDSLNKLMFIASQLYPEWAKKVNKSGFELNRTLSYCIEAMYNTLEKPPANLCIYDSLPPPKTIKAQKLYSTYQLITTLKAEGYSVTKILAYLNEKNLPTPDDIFKQKPLTAIEAKHSRWEKCDVNSLFTDEGQPSELLREYLRKLNTRSQRKREPGASSSR